MRLTYICLWIVTNLLLILASYYPISDPPATTFLSVSHLSCACYLFHHSSYPLTQYAVPKIHVLGFKYQQPSPEGISNDNVLPTISNRLNYRYSLTCQLARPPYVEVGYIRSSTCPLQV